MQQRLDGRSHHEQPDDKPINVPLGVGEQSSDIEEQQAAQGGGDEGEGEGDEFYATEDRCRVLPLGCEGGGGVAGKAFGGGWVEDSTGVRGVVDVPGD